MSTTNVPLTLLFSGFAEGYCPTGWTSLGNDLAERLSGTIAGQFNGINYGDDTPDVADRGRPWVRTILGVPDRMYIWSSTAGAWVAKHGSAPGICTLWTGSVASIDTFDGGEAGTVGDATGPMWEVVTDAAGRFLVHPGTTANGTSITVATTGGADEVTLVQDNLPSVQLDVPIPKEYTSATDTGVGEITTGSSGNEPSDARTLLTEEMGSDEPFSILPPWYGTYLIRRTARIFYRV